MNKENPNSFQFQIEQFSPKNIDKKIHNLRYSELSYQLQSIDKAALKRITKRTHLDK